MREPRGHWKCWAKSGELDRVPMTRYLGGLWESVIRPSWALSGVRTEHHTWGEYERERGRERERGGGNERKKERERVSE